MPSRNGPNYAARLLDLRRAIEVQTLKEGDPDSECPLWGPKEQQALGSILVDAVRWLSGYRERGASYIRQIEDAIERTLGHRRPTADLPKGTMDAAWAATYSAVIECAHGEVPEFGEDVRLWEDDDHAIPELMIAYDMMAEELAAILASAEQELGDSPAHAGISQQSEPPFHGNEAERRQWVCRRRGITLGSLQNLVKRYRDEHKGTPLPWSVFHGRNWTLDLEAYLEWEKTQTGRLNKPKRRPGRPPKVR